MNEQERINTRSWIVGGIVFLLIFIAIFGALIYFFEKNLRKEEAACVKAGGEPVRINRSNTVLCLKAGSLVRPDKEPG